MVKLIGKKVILRELKSFDSTSLFKNINDPIVVKYIDISYPYSLNKAEQYIKKAKYDIQRRKSYRLGIELPNKKEIIGVVGLVDIDWKNKKAELEYWLGKNYWRQGFGSESIILILGFGFNKLRLNRVFAKVLAANIASIKLLEKLNFIYEGKLRKALLEKKRWKDLFVYSMLKEEFRNYKLRVTKEK